MGPVSVRTARMTSLTHVECYYRRKCRNVGCDYDCFSWTTTYLTCPATCASDHTLIPTPGEASACDEDDLRW